ncbi:hypothetical protein GCM10011578_015190 [Streptomyces fuscichromogenes]|uniref:Uncharacterized protein n=1 Tax=Streptomyces fuscichromogenes TaxID=1324013 RepID=A0A917X9I0_9ACTN|nr:hypothetical protein GCM10011578_015190 [Streptomyces fuscichromogenes]
MVSPVLEVPLGRAPRKGAGAKTRRGWRASCPPRAHAEAGNLTRAWPMADPAVTRTTVVIVTSRGNAMAVFRRAGRLRAPDGRSRRRRAGPPAGDLGDGRGDGGGFDGGRTMT